MSDDMRDDLHRVEDRLADLGERIAKHEGRDDERHIAVMAIATGTRDEVTRLGDAIRDLASRGPRPGLAEPTTTDAERSDERAIVARVRLPKLPAPMAVKVAAQWGVTLLLIGFPLLAAILGTVGLAPASVQAVADAIGQATPDAAKDDAP